MRTFCSQPQPRGSESFAILLVFLPASSSRGAVLLLVFFSLLTNDPILGALPDWLLHNYISFLVGIIVDLKKKGGGELRTLEKLAKIKLKKFTTSFTQ